MRKLALATISVAFLLTTAAAHAVDPAAICQSGKLKASGKYASCVLGADAKAVKSGKFVDESKCVATIDKNWAKAETKGAGMCPGGTGDETDIKNFLDGCRTSVAGALATTGNTLPVPGGVGRSFTDNGDGTITDDVTGLMWEKLSDDGSIHDQDNQYTLGDAASVKVAGLNAANFAGHNDWRVPDRFELETLINLGTYLPATYAAFNTGCAPGCTVTTCSCTVSSTYWSSTPFAYSPSYAWGVSSHSGQVFVNDKAGNYSVRAVRGGS